MHDDTDSAEALETSARLVALIRDTIAGAGGWIPFSRFMELALYAPGLGYYSAGATKVGNLPGGGSDFVTAPELTPLFGRALARPVAAIVADGARSVVELGGGSGRLAADLLLELEALDALPAEYLLLEVSADFRERQAATLAERAPHLAGRVRWPDALPDRLDGAVVANEVLDALPVDLVVWDGRTWHERGVVLDEQVLAFADRPAGVRPALSAFLTNLAPTLVPSYLTETHAVLRGLVGSLVSRMSDASVLLFIDYGFPESEYYHPSRSAGTLMAHRRHRVSLDLLARPGLQDLTAHVDFSAVASAARAAGGTTIGYASQSAFLIDCGIGDLLHGDAIDPRSWAPQAAALQILLSEAEMGELFKVIGIARRERDLVGFGGTDRRGAL